MFITEQHRQRRVCAYRSAAASLTSGSRGGGGGVTSIRPPLESKIVCFLPLNFQNCWATPPLELYNLVSSFRKKIRPPLDIMDPPLGSCCCAPIVYSAITKQTMQLFLLIVSWWYVCCSRLYIFEPVSLVLCYCVGCTVGQTYR